MGISSNIISPFPKCYMTFWDMPMYNDTLNWSDIIPMCELITELDFITDFDLIAIFWGFNRTLQRVRLANRGSLLLRTSGPVPFGTCICSNVETILSWTCHVYGPFDFRASLGTSICFEKHLESSLDHTSTFCRNLVIFCSKNMCLKESLTRFSTVI